VNVGGNEQSHGGTGAKAIRLEFGLFADAADIGRTGKVSLVGGNIETLTAPSFPAEAPSLALVAFLAVPDEEAGKEHTLTLEIAGPDGDIIFPGDDVSYPIRPQPNTYGLPVRHLVVLNLAGLTVSVAGKHEARLIIDGMPAGSIYLAVIDGSADGSRPQEER
jgi:hypothetical protein